MPIGDDVPRPRQSFAEPKTMSFTLPAYVQTEFQEEFLRKMDEVGLKLDRDVVLSITPIGSRSAETAESFFVKVTFNAGTMDKSRVPRSSVMEIMDVIDNFNQNSLQNQP